MDQYDVSVIIPTVLRPELLRAVRSTREPGTNVEVVLVIDRGLEASCPSEVRNLVDVVIHTGGGRGAGHARNLGVRAARAPWVAFLDDDDEFLPGKLRAQLNTCEFLARAGHRPVVSCRAVHRWEAPAAESAPLPSRLYRSGEPLEEYLFRRRRLGVDRASVFAPTLMVEAALAREVPWDEHLRRHQDWDFLLRALSVPGSVLEQLPITGTACWIGAGGSMSGDADWRSSLGWATRWRGRWSPRVYSDFLVAQPLRYALHARSPEGCRAVVKELLHARALPSASAMTLGLAGVLPRNVLEAGAAAATRRS
ncbi:glycosyltransferase family 2 protein [Knoellia sp. p5-6-4]|uniref:glycosyltransferase family 2 protein n=1 Tax=unclassified Knoellia TaxID=2618719 RepID=UPI0023DCE2C0|nr:glycosyltransferase family 2 protein [Knoellia sp. p5-6-4]MDF2144474.1 glycosyltransferase family 2 protein [Knoellia sp. p5-6-4]